MVNHDVVRRSSSSSRLSLRRLHLDELVPLEVKPVGVAARNLHPIMRHRRLLALLAFVELCVRYHLYCSERINTTLVVAIAHHLNRWMMKQR